MLQKLPKFIEGLDWLLTNRPDLAKLVGLWSIDSGSVLQVAPSHKTSLTLLGRLQQGHDEEAWELFVAIYQPLIGKYLMSLRLPAFDVEDLVHECFAELVTDLGNFQHNGRTGAFRRWLRTIVLGRARRALSNRMAFPLSNDRLDALACLDDSFQGFWDAENVHAALDAIFATACFDLIEQELVLLMRTNDRDAEHFFDGTSRTGVVYVTMRQPNGRDLDLQLLDCRSKTFGFATRVHDRGLHRFGRPDDRRILL